ncbi:hypothetical protein [Cyanobium sp. NIES-981]|uniref:hypothetical protein n=1 Tax=Cyanobium sp. NIES-981 TaxID=1851505 RepID=UPI0007DCE008|nr:hypothetical protein [Cyanobium sp. NIES-981]SBO42120.1 conserved membrane protein of unknown function [Cyanobium sp. NIES-981]
MNWGRALLVWLLMMLAETLQGILRQKLLSPVLGDLPARQLGVLSGSLLVLLISWLARGWMGAASRPRLLRVGGAWVALTVAFELAVGKALGYGSARLLADYDPRQGGYLGFGLLVMLVAPALTAASGDGREPPPARSP